MCRTFLFGAALPFLLLSAGCDDGRIRFPQVPAPDELPTLAERFGMAHRFPGGDGAEAAAVRADQLARLKLLGVRRARIDFPWQELEPEAGRWDFSQLDPVVEDTASAGIQLLAVLAYGNPAYPIAAGEDDNPADLPSGTFSPPSDPDDYGRFVRKVVERYAPRGVREYELWNEPNVGHRFWRPAEDPAHFARVAAAGARAGREACPSCRFIVGGLSVAQPVPTADLYTTAAPFLRGMYAELPELDEVFDAVGYHTYQYPKDPPEFETAPFEERVQGSQQTQTRALREVMRESGEELPLWLTGNGWPTNPGVPESTEDIARIFGVPPAVIEAARLILGDDFPTLVETIRGVSEEQQAQYVVRGALIAASLGVPRIIHHALDDRDVENHVNQEGAFGVFRLDASEKAAAQPIRTLLKRFGEYRFAADLAGPLGLEEPDRALAFRDGRHILVVLWRWRDGTRTLRLSELPGDAEAFDHRGDSLERVLRGQDIELELGPEVVWLEITP